MNNGEYSPNILVAAIDKDVQLSLIHIWPPAREEIQGLDWQHKTSNKGRAEIFSTPFL